MNKIVFVRPPKQGTAITKNEPDTRFARYFWLPNWKWVRWILQWLGVKIL